MYWPANQDCPTCNGKGTADVGLIGFDQTWRAKCPDCDGTGKVSWVDAQRIRKRNEARRKKGQPLTPPGGTYGKARA